MPDRRRTPLWVAARATNRALLLKAYGSAYLSEYRALVARFDQRPIASPPANQPSLGELKRLDEAPPFEAA